MLVKQKRYVRRVAAAARCAAYLTVVGWVALGATGCDDKGADTDGASTQSGAVSTGKEGGATPGLAPQNGKTAPPAVVASPSPLPAP